MPPRGSPPAGDDARPRRGASHVNASFAGWSHERPNEKERPLGTAALRARTREDLGSWVIGVPRRLASPSFRGTPRQRRASFASLASTYVGGGEPTTRYGAAISAWRQRPPPRSGVRFVGGSPKVLAASCREVWALGRDGNLRLTATKEEDVLAIAGTGYGVIGLLVIILLVVLIVYFARRA
jgi:hypothetical protein